jgi:presenilin-like A22 family membrane protease
MMRRVSILLLLSFVIVLATALFAGWNFIYQEVSIVENPADLLNAAFFFGYIIVATFILILVLKVYKGKNLFRAIELLLEFSAIQVFLSIFANALFSLAGALALVAVRFSDERLKTPFLMFATAVVGALLGSSLDLLPAMILAWLLAAYDYYAVFHSKHMVFLAKQLDQRQAAFAISLKEKKESVLLGTGDFVMPAMLAVSAMKTSLAAGLPVALFAGLATAFGALVGLGLLVWHMEKNKGYYPALPPIVAGATALYLVQMVVFA